MLPELIDREAKLGLKDGKNRGKHKAAAGSLGEDFGALVESIRQHGIREKIKVVKAPRGNTWWIVDGRHRHAAGREVMRVGVPQRNGVAMSLSKRGFPCVEVRKDEVEEIILDATVGKPVSKGARAYLAVLMFPEVATEAKRGRPAANKSAVSAEYLGQRVGVATRLIEYAIWLYREFEKDEAARLKFEPSIWVGYGLERVKSGMEGMKAGNEGEEDDTPEETVGGVRYRQSVIACAELRETWKQWDELEQTQRERTRINTVKVISDAPEAVRIAVMEELNQKD